MEKRKRPVEVKTFVWDNEHRMNIPLNFKGLFHEWGVESEFEDVHGFGNYTVGIVEDDFGQIFTVNPNHIQFLDRN